MSKKRRQEIKLTKATERRRRREDKQHQETKESLVANSKGLFYSLSKLGWLSIKLIGMICPFVLVGYLIYKAIYG